MSDGFWLSYLSGPPRRQFAIFATEVEALRYAVERFYRVRFVPWGEVNFESLISDDEDAA